MDLEGVTDALGFRSASILPNSAISGGCTVDVFERPVVEILTGVSGW
jgi:hypothetical protein